MFNLEFVHPAASTDAFNCEGLACIRSSRRDKFQHRSKAFGNSLTTPGQLAKWFADTTHFAPAAPVRFDFGDGDFFRGEVVEWEPEIALGLRWKFVGHGPEYNVLFSLLGASTEPS